METKTQQQSLWSKSFVDIQNDVTTKDLQQAIKKVLTDRAFKRAQRITWELTKEKLVVLIL